MPRSPIAQGLALIALLSTSLNASAAGEAKVICEIMENGKPASGALLVLDGSVEVARASCGKPVSVPAGEHTAVLTLDGALDAPEQRQVLLVQPDKTAKLAADFATGLLEVHITSQGRDTPGMAIIRRDGRQIGTLGSGVSAHLSAGTYQVLARYRAQERSFENVVLQKGQRIVLDARFE